MADIIPFSDSFLPHVIRLCYPDAKQVEPRIDHLKLQLTIGQSRQTAVLLKDDSSLLGFAHLYYLDHTKPALLYLRIAAADSAQPEQLEEFWNQIQKTAADLCGKPYRFRTIIPSQSNLCPLLETKGFKPGLELTEFSLAIENLALPEKNDDNIVITSLADDPGLEARWIDVFNQGQDASWIYPPFASEQMETRRQFESFDPGAFHLGLVGNEPVGAMMYEVADSEQGLVDIYTATSAAGKRTRDFARRLLRSMLVHLKVKGYRQARLRAEARHHAGNLLYKLMGFKPGDTTVVWESEEAMAIPIKGLEGWEALAEAMDKISRQGSLVTVNKTKPRTE